MRRIFLVCLIAMLVAFLVSLCNGAPPEKTKSMVALGVPTEFEGVCPKTTMTKSCLTCHVAPSFKLKESAPDAGLDYPVTNMKLIGTADNWVQGYFLLHDIDSDGVKKFLDYLDIHKIHKAIIEIHSPGEADLVPRES